jgi:hypothetical protein
MSRSASISAASWSRPTISFKRIRSATQATGIADPALAHGRIRELARIDRQARLQSQLNQGLDGGGRRSRRQVDR